MDKRYQVFVSSTYVDLIEERKVVFQTLMEMDCIPAGMELFPAADEEQFEFIKRVIDDCDYYLLIIGGRYGSLAEDQISYTEKEFDYAVEKGKKVVVLVHRNPDQIPAGKTELNPDIREKLDAFKKKAMTGRLVDFWEEPKDLRGLVAVSLNKTIKMFPAVGWVRGNKVASLEMLNEIEEIRLKNKDLIKQLEAIALSNEIGKNSIADFSSNFQIKIDMNPDRYWTGYDSRDKSVPVLKTFTKTWQQLFSLMLPSLLSFPRKRDLENDLIAALTGKPSPDIGYLETRRIANFDIILAQIQAYGLIAVEYVTSRDGSTETMVKLTRDGNKRAVKNLVVK